MFITRDADCTATESPPPRCTLKSIDPETTQVRHPILYGVMVINNCDPASPPAEPATAAVAVVMAPRFTG